MPIRKRKSSRRKNGTVKRRKTSSRSKAIVRSGTGPGKYKYGRQAPDVLTFMSKLFNPCPLPHRFVTTTSCQNQGYYPAATGIGAYFQVSLNCPQLPFSLATTVSGSQIPNPVTAITTLNSLAFGSLVQSRLYNSYRVYASKIRIKIIPTALSDPLAVGIYPAIPGSALNYGVSDNMPFSKNWLVTSEKGYTVLENFVTLPELNGISSQALRDDVSLTYTGSTAAAPLRPFNWYVNWYDLTQNNIGARVGIDCQVIYYMELFDLNYDYLAQT